MEKTIASVLESPMFKQEQIIKVNTTDNFFVVLWTLQKNKITSAPVWDEEKKEYCSVVDLLDIVTFALATYEDRKLLYERELLQFATNELVNNPDYNAHVMANMSTRNSFVKVSRDAPIKDVVALFADKSGLHRVCVTDEEGQVTAVVSQTDLVRHMAVDQDFFKEAIGGLKVENWAVKALHSCNCETTAATAFELLIDKRVSAIPVIDEEGHLITSFSASDLKGVTPGVLFKTLEESVVKLLRTSEQVLRPGQYGRAAISCHLGESLVDVLEKMLHHSIHRVWVVDEKNVAIGVVSLGDVFTKIHEHQKK